jgi:uncharacterized protein YndB with AHSA1/START domain
MDHNTTTFEHEIRISAPPREVWRALCLPEEVAQWDGGVQFALDAPPNYPQPGQRVRWRTTGAIFRTLVDQPQDVVPERRLRSILSLGPARYDETYTIQTARDSPTDLGDECLLHMKMTLQVVAVPGHRLLFRRFASTTPGSMVSALAAIKTHCESYRRERGTPTM